MADLEITNSHESQALLKKLQNEISETYRGVLELAYETGDSDNFEQVLALKNEVNKLATELDETYQGIIEFATSLESSEQKVDMMLQGAEIGLWEWQPENDEYSVNAEWKTIIGLPQQHEINNIKDYEELIHHDDLANVRRARTLFMKGKREVFHVEHRIKSSENNWIWVMCNGRAVERSKDGALLKAMGSMLNISGRKKTENKIGSLNVKLEQEITERTLEIERTNNKLHEEVRGHQETVRALRQARKAAETANNAKSSFVANMSHELRTPLNAILGYAQLMALDENLDVEQTQQVTAINRAGKHLLGLLNNVLDMAKIESGHISRNLKAFDLFQLLYDIKAIFILRSHEKKLKFEFILDSDVPQFILSDEQKIRQILINLLGNAFKFTDNGKVMLKVSSLEKKAQKQKLLFKVKDTGIGVNEESVSNIFNAFEQTEEGKQVQEGTGLGLTISREFALFLGGDITIDATVKTGGCFDFTCQVETVQMKLENNSQQNYRITYIKPGQKKISVIVADDDDAGRDVVVKLLSSIGMDTHQAENNKQLTSQLSKYKPNILIVNLNMMTEGNVDYINSHNRLIDHSEMIVIGLSTSASVIDVESTLSQSVDAIVYKPIDLNCLLQTIDQHTEIDFISEKTVENKFNETDSSLSIITDLINNLSMEQQKKLKKLIFLGGANELRIFSGELEKQNDGLSGLLNKYINDYNLEPLRKLFNKELK